MALLEESVDRAVLGLTSHATHFSEEERRVAAFHGAGHAMVAMGVPGATVPHKLFLGSGGGALGHCTFVDPGDRSVLLCSALKAQLAVLLGGRTAEHLVFGETSSVSAGDLRQAGDLACRMVRDFGMSDDLGSLALLGVPAGGGSEPGSATVDAAVRRLLEEATARARSVLGDARSELEAVAQTLLERESLTAGELKTVVRRPAGRPADQL